MELTKNIFFNTDKLVENTTVKIYYTGSFFQDGSDNVSIHYGFGMNWDGVNDVEMKKTELGFQAEVNLTGVESFNFCFRNGEDRWDNNEGQNYIFPIENCFVSVHLLSFLTYINTKLVHRNLLKLLCQIPFFLILHNIIKKQRSVIFTPTLPYASF